MNYIEEQKMIQAFHARSSLKKIEKLYWKHTSISWELETPKQCSWISN